MSEEQFYIVIYKKFANRKVETEQDLIKTQDITKDLKKLKVLNAQKRITTAEYIYVNLSELLKNNSLSLKEE